MSTKFFQISLFLCSVSPFLDQVFRCFFSMDNLRGYGEDEQRSSSSLGRSVEKLPSSSKGPVAPPTTQASVMADCSPAVTPVTSGPVPTVSAPSQPASSVPMDSVLPLDDLPPPPLAEPYEVFMAWVQRDLSSLPVLPMQSGAAVPPRAAVATPTTGSRLPTPFPRFEDSSWALQPQARNIRIRMPLPASCYVAPPSPWVWPGRGSSIATAMVRGTQPASLPAAPSGPSGPSGRLAGPSTVGPSPVPPPTMPAVDPKMTSPTPTPALSRIFFRVPRPLLSLLRHRPAWTLSLLRWRSKMLGPFPRDQPRRWSKDGRRNSWWTWELFGNNS